MQKIAGITPNQSQQKNKVAGITPEQAQQKNTISGITTQQILSKASGDIMNYINTYKENYDKMLDAYLNPKAGFFDWGGGIVYSLIKGPGETIIGAGQFIATLFAQLHSDLKKIPGNPFLLNLDAVSEGQGAEVAEGYKDLFLGFAGNAFLGVYAGLAGAIDRGSQLVTGEDLGLVDGTGPLRMFGIKEAERFIRAAQNGDFSSLYRDLANDFLFPGQKEADNERNIAETEARYEDTQDTINFIVDSGKFLNNELVEPIASIFKTKDYEYLMQNNELFSLIMSTVQAIGGILTMWGVGKLGAKAGLSPRQTQALSNAYFFSSVAGRSMTRALDNGASLQDAYTYAIGMAATEVALENLAGFTTTGVAKKTIFDDLLSKLFGAKIASVITNVVGEGLEEVGVEFADTGLAYFGENQETYKRPNNEEFFKRAVFAFTTGALASAGLGAGQFISYQFTIDKQLSNLSVQFDSIVEKEGIDEARKKFESRLGSILNQLNSPFARGQKVNKQGTPFTGKFNEADKDLFLIRSGLKRFFTKENGVYKLNQEQINKIDENIFKNKFGKGRVVPIVQTDFAFNPKVQGIEFNVDMNVDETTLVPKENLTPEGKIALDYVEDSNIPHVIYNDPSDNTQAFLDGEQNVIFINEAKLVGKSAEQILDVLVTHEAIHYIKNLAPELYDDIQKEVLSMIQITIKDGVVVVSSKNKLLQDFLNTKDYFGNTYAENLQTSFQDLLDSIEQKGLPKDKTNALLVEEATAYFIERMVSGKTIGRSFEKNGTRLQELFESDQIQLESLFGKDKKTIKRFQKLSKQVYNAALEASRRQVTFGYLIDNLLGPDFINILKDEIVSKHSEESIIEGFRFGINKDKRTIQFDNDVYDIDNIYREGFGPNNFNPKRMEPEKKSPRIKFNLNDIKKYNTYIDKFVLANENFSELPAKEQLEIKSKIARYQEVQDILNRINSMPSVLQKEALAKVRITDDVLDVLTEVMTVNVSVRGISKEQEAIFFLTNKLIEDLNRKKSKNEFPFVNLHNVPTIQGAKYEKIIIGEGLAQAHKEGLEIWLDAKLTVLNLDSLYDVDVFLTTGKETQTVVAVVKPNALAIRQEVARIEVLRREQESMLENKDATEDNRLTLRERLELDKFYTQKGMAKNLIDQAIDILDPYIINPLGQKVRTVKGINFVEPSAGGGALILAMLEAGVEVNRITAFDINPEYKEIKGVRIIKMDFFDTNDTYDSNTVTVANPPFGVEGDLAIKFINHAAKNSVVVAAILPSIFKDRKHEFIDDSLKLVSNVLNESQRFDVGTTTRLVKTVSQVWVNKNDSRFKAYPDLRVKKTAVKKSTDYTSIKYTGKTQTELTILDKNKTKEIVDWYQKTNGSYPQSNTTFKYKDKEYTVRITNYGNLQLQYSERVEIISMINLEPDVIVLTEIMSKNASGVDFNQYLYNVEDMKPSNKYMAIRFNQANGIDILRAMDLNVLSQTSRLSRIGFSGDEFQSLFEETKIKMKRVEGKRLSPLDAAGNRLSAQQQLYFENSKARVDGKLMVLYHGSPNKEIESFDSTFAGKNTGVFERLMYFTNDLLTAENFAYPSKETNSMFIRQRTGEMGKIYSLYVNITNPLDFRNLRTKDINFLISSFEETLGSDKEDAERSVRRGIENNNHQFLKIGISDVTVRNAGYDGIIAEMYRGSGIFEFGVLNPEQIKSIDNKQPTNDKNINDRKLRMKRISDYSIKNLQSLSKRDVVIENDNYLEDSKNIDKKTKNNMAYWEGRYVMESTQVLQEIAAYDRLINRTFNTSFQDTVEYFVELQKNILKNGIKKPIEIHYNPDNNFVHIAHGNHRLIAALALYIDNIPVIWVENKSLQIPKKGTIVSGVVLKNLKVGKLELESNVKEYINVDYDTLPNEVLYSYVLRSDKGFEIYQEEPDFENSEFNNVVLDLTRFLDVESISIDIQENDIPEALSAVYTTASEIVKNAKEINAYVVNFEELSDSMKYFFKLLKRTNLQFAFFESYPGAPLGFYVDKTVYINALTYDEYVKRVGEKSAAALLFSTVMHEVTHGIFEESSTLFYKIAYLDNYIFKDDSVKVSETERKLYKNYLKFTNTIKNAFFIYNEDGLLLDTTELFNNLMKDDSTMFRKKMYEFFEGYIVPDSEINGLKEHRRNVQKNLDYADGYTYEDLDGRILSLSDGGTGMDLVFIANKLNEEDQNDIKEEFYPRVVELLTNSNLYKNVFKDKFTEKEIKGFSKLEYNLKLKPIQTTFENLFEDYFQQMSKEYSKKIRMKRVSDDKINTEEQKKVQKIFGTYINQLLQLNNSGEYVVKNEYVNTTIQKPAVYTIELKNNQTIELSNEEYAISLPYTFGDNVKISKSDESIFINKNKTYSVITLKDLAKNKPMRLIYDLLKSTNLPFVFVNKPKSDYLGLYFAEIQSTRVASQNMIVLNMGVSDSISFDEAFVALLHEHIHAMTKQYGVIYTQNVRKAIAQFLFTYDANNNFTGVTKSYELFVDTYYGGDFISYIGLYEVAKNIIKSEEDIYNILIGNTATYTNALISNADISATMEELTAQFVPNLLLKDKLFFELSKINPNSFIEMGVQFENMMKFDLSNRLQFELFNNIQTEFKSRFKKYLDANVAVLFTDNLKKNYTVKDINQFIKEFTSGDYTTKSQLMADYLREQQSDKKGKASQTVENIIYVASMLGPVVRKSVEEYTEIENLYLAVSKEMNDMTKALNIILFEPAKVARIFDKSIEKSYKNIDGFRKFVSTSDKGKKLADTYNDDGTFKDTFLETFEENFIDFQDSLVEFAQLYNEIEPSILTVFGLSSNDFVQAKVLDLINATNTLFEKDFTLNEFEVLLKTFTTEVSIVLKKDSIPVKFAEFQRQNQEQFTKNILNALDKYNRQTMDSILSVSRQAQSPLNEDLNNINIIISKIREAFEVNTFKIKDSRNQIIPLIVQLQDYVEQSTRIDQENLDRMDATIFSNIYLQLALLYEDDTIIRRATRLFTDQKEYYDVVQLKKIVKKFNENKLAMNINNILKAFATQYTTVFDDAQTLDEYANQNMVSILSIDKQWETKSLNKFAGVMTPQDFFALMIDLSQGKVRFFEDFYREYINADFKRSDIIQDYIENIKAFNAANPDAFKKSLEKVVIGTQYLSPIPNDVINSIIEKVDAQFQSYNEIIRKKNKQIQDIRKANVIIRSQINVIKETKKGLDKKSPEWAKENNNQKVLAQEIKDNLKVIQELTQENVRTRAIRDVGTREEFIILEMKEYSDDNNLKTEVSYGQLLSLYKSIKRELETAAMYELDSMNNINPTDHFRVLNTIDFFDNELARREGYVKAKDNTDRYVILIEKEKVLNYLETLIRPIDRIIMDFADTMFDKMYNYVDAVFFSMYQVHLPKSPTYIPLTTKNSMTTRNFEIKTKNRTNLKPYDGMTIETTIGATTPLMIENIFGVVSNSFQRTGNYVYRRILSDYQNLLINVQKNSTFQNELSSKTSKFGPDNGLQRMIEMSFKNILKYGDIDVSEFEKQINKVLNRLVGGTMALNIPSMVLQTASIITIALKNKIPIDQIVKNVIASLVPNDDFKWLMRNNSNFFMRALVGNIPALSQDINTNLYMTMNEGFQKITNFLSRHISFADTVILVGAFKTLVQQEMKNNSTLSIDEARVISNEKFKEILLFGVANTSPAFRSNFSNSTKTIDRIASRYQSENVLQISAIIRDIYMVRNKIPGGREKLTRDLFSQLFSALFSAIIAIVFDLLRGRVEEEEIGAVYLLNEMVWNNMLGAIPYYNMLLRMIQFTEEGVELGFEPQMPLVSDVYRIAETAVSMQNGKNLGRKSLRLLENMTGILGIPARNTVRILSTWSNFLGEQGIEFAQDSSKFFYSKTNAQMLTEAVRTGNKSQINNYIDNVYNNYTVKNEITNLLFSVEGAKINLYDVNTFRKVEEGVSKEYTIPDDVRDRYNTLSQRSLIRLINSQEYRALSKKDRISKIQRVINYYYNTMKADVLDEEFDLLTVEEVANRALK